MDTVARCAGHIESNYALLAQYGVYQCGFADVRPTDNGKNGMFDFVAFFFGIGEVFQHFLNQVIHTVAVRAGNHIRFAQRQFVKLGGQDIVAAAFAFIDRQIHRTRTLAQAVGNDFVLRCQTCTCVHQEDDGIGLIYGLQCLFGHFVQDAAVHDRLETAGIDDQIGFAAQTAVTVMAVAREAGQIVHQCVFSAG